jgi:hypothetical protein
MKDEEQRKIHPSSFRLHPYALRLSFELGVFHLDDLIVFKVVGEGLELAAERAVGALEMDGLIGLADGGEERGGGIVGDVGGVHLAALGGDADFILGGEAGELEIGFGIGRGGGGFRGRKFGGDLLSLKLEGEGGARARAGGVGLMNDADIAHKRGAVGGLIEGQLLFPGESRVAAR